MSNQFGDKIKQLREANSLLQRQVASELQIDTPMLSKIERGERKAKKEQVQEMVQRLLNLPSLPGPDAADALGVAICHAHHRASRLIWAGRVAQAI